MPCKNCYTLFQRKPCEQDPNSQIYITLSSSLEVLNSVYISTIYTKQLTPYIVEIYKDLITNCPCVECLVNQTCSNDALCSNYMNFINSHSPTFDRCVENMKIEPETRIKEDIEDDPEDNKMTSPIVIEEDPDEHYDINNLLRIPGNE